MGAKQAHLFSSSWTVELSCIKVEHPVALMLLSTVHWSVPVTENLWLPACLPCFAQRCTHGASLLAFVLQLAWETYPAPRRSKHIRGALHSTSTCSVAQTHTSAGGYISRAPICACRVRSAPTRHCSMDVPAQRKPTSLPSADVLLCRRFRAAGMKDHGHPSLRLVHEAGKPQMQQPHKPTAPLAAPLPAWRWNENW